MILALTFTLTPNPYPNPIPNPTPTPTPNPTEERAVPAAWADPEGEQSACGAWFHDGWAHTDC